MNENKKKTKIYLVLTNPYNRLHINVVFADKLTNDIFCGSFSIVNFSESNFDVSVIDSSAK